jgi:hypothetical protein
MMKCGDEVDGCLVILLVTLADLHCCVINVETRKLIRGLVLKIILLKLPYSMCGTPNRPFLASRHFLMLSCMGG